MRNRHDDELIGVQLMNNIKRETPHG